MAANSGSIPKQRSWYPAALILGAILSLLPLILFSYMGSFSRYIADDFCTVGTLNKFGFGGSQSYWYQHWSGRFAFTFVINLLETAGTWVPRVLPVLFTTLWTLSVYSLFNSWQAGLRVQLTKLSNAVLAVLIVAVTLIGAPNLYQSLFWMTGSVTYILPLVILTGYLGWIIYEIFIDGSEHISTLKLILSLMVGFIIGGFSETIASVLVITLTWLTLVSVILLRKPNRRKALGYLSAGLVGAILSVVLILTSPGTSVRQGLVTETTPILWVLEQSIRDLYVFSVISLKSEPLALLLIVLLPAGIVLQSSVGLEERDTLMSFRTGLALLLLIPITTALAMLATIGPYRYAIGYYPDGRVLITTRYFLILGMALWGTVLGVFVPQLIRLSLRSRELIANVLIGFGFLLLAFVTFNAVRYPEPPIEELKQYADSWDSRDRALNAAVGQGVREASAASLTHMGGLDELTRDPDDWVNHCVAWTYGLDRVVAK